jgi:hypothetical protein
MKLNEAIAALDKLPVRHYSIRFELDKGSGLRWSVWDGSQWNHGATLKQAVESTVAGYGMGVGGTVKAAEESLACVAGT